MKIEHVAIVTGDLERLRGFYETYFDATAGDKYTNAAKQLESYFLSFESGARLELMRMPSTPASHDDRTRPLTGLFHVAFSTGSKARVDELTGRLQQDGFTIADGPRRTGDGYYESVVLDPDGNRVEITI
jgi:lactoylglutathione lyase